MTFSPDDSPIREGDVIDDKYVVERIIGVGGMGVVAAARHVELGQQVALKFMLPQALAVLVQWNASCAKPDPSFSCRAST